MDGKRGVRTRTACRARCRGAAGLALLAGVAWIAACSTTAEMAEKTGTWEPPTFDSVTGYLALASEVPALCAEGQTTITLDRDGQAAGFVVPLNRGGRLGLATGGAEDLDTVLAVYGPADDTGYYGRTAVAWDDDGGRGRLARIESYTAARGGRYLVLLSTYEGTGRGPVELQVTVDDAPGCVALRKDLPDLDVLFVVDDSPSMAQEQRALARGFREFLSRLDPTGDADLRIAVTTTNVCPANKEEAVRGRFLYQPQSDPPPSAVEKRDLPCLTDADCQARTDLPDAANWVCEARPAQDMWVCDVPPEAAAEGATDSHEGDLLFAVSSQCRYLCTDPGDPVACTKTFGLGPRCEATCGDTGCSPEDCVTVGNPSERCQRACESDNCPAFCGAYLGDAAACATVCGAGDCLAACAGDLETTGTFDGQDFLCRVACTEAASCEVRCATEFRDRGEQPYRCLFPGGDATKAGCLMQPLAESCPEGVPTVLTPAVARDFVGLWRQGLWRGDPSWKGLTEADLQRQVMARLLGCQAEVGAAQTICGNQEQGLRAAVMALDGEGENGEQARQFLRDGAYLLVVLIGDEDDCSAPEYEKSPGVFTNRVPAEDFSRCPCLRDWNGCLPGGECDEAACLTGGQPDLDKCPLLPVSTAVQQLQALKADVSRVLFATFSGAVVPGSALSPSQDAEAIRQRYRECKCDAKAPRTAPFTYACMSALGRADQGDRHRAVAEAFGEQGWFGNLCGGVDLFALADFVRSATGAAPVVD